jgi:hypothetical protein
VAAGVGGWADWRTGGRLNSFRPGGYCLVQAPRQLSGMNSELFQMLVAFG